MTIVQSRFSRLNRSLFQTPLLSSNDKRTERFNSRAVPCPSLFALLFEPKNEDNCKPCIDINLVPTLSLLFLPGNEVGIDI